MISAFVADANGTRRQLCGRPVIWFVAALLAISGCGSERRDGIGESNCNVILISVDTLRADYMPCYGYNQNTTPNICRFAQKATLYQNAYSPAPSTVPALRAVMTGQTISNSAARDILAFYEKQEFLAEILAKSGYTTAAFTDHHALGKNNDVSGFNLKSASILTKGFGLFSNDGLNESSVTSQILANHVIQWLEQNYKKKFFLWAHFFDPHFNYNPLPAYESEFGYNAASCGRIVNGITIEQLRAIESELHSKELDCLTALYKAEVLHTDEHIGRLLKEIAKLGLDKNSLIIVFADHGEEFKERNRIGHEWTVYNELIHVPLLVHFPGQDGPRVAAETISTAQLFHIVKKAALGNEAPISNVAISRAYHYYAQGRTRPNEYTLISGDKKVIFTAGSGRTEYYELKDDPREKIDRMGNAGSADMRKKLLEWIEIRNQKTDKPSPETLKVDEQTQERLKALGYL